MDEMYDRFKLSANEIFTKYDESIIRTVFEDTVAFIQGNEEERFSDADIAEFVRDKLKKQNIFCMSLDPLLLAIMDFLCIELGFTNDSYENHTDMIKKIVWNVLAEKTNDFDNYLNPLTDAVIEEFSACKDSVSSLDIANILFDNPDFSFLSFDILYNIVDTVYDYFLKQKLIEPE